MSIAPPKVELPKENDREAWQELVDKYQPCLLALARQFPLDEAEVQDAVQHTWVRLLERHSSVKNPQALAGWLRAVCRNECLNRLRHGTRTMSTDPEDFVQLSPPQQQYCPDEIAVHNLQRSTLQEALKELRPTVRSVVVGSVVEKRPYKELQQMLNVPAGSIGPIRMRALNKLRKSQQITNLVMA